MITGKSGVTKRKQSGTHGRRVIHGKNQESPLIRGKTTKQALPLEVGKLGEARVEREAREARRAARGGGDAQQPRMREGFEKLILLSE